MKKAIKIVYVLLIAMVFVATLNATVMAVDYNSVIGGMQNADVSDSTSGITTIGGKITSIITTVGIIVAVIVLLVLGIKYMIGSASEKAEYKKTMIPYVVGAVLIIAASAIVKAVFSMANGIMG